VVPLMVMALVYGLIVAAGLRQSQGQLLSRRRVYLFLVIGGATLLLLGIGWMKHFRVLGRPFTPVVRACLWVLAEGVCALWRSGKVVQRLLVVLFLILSTASCLSLRLASRHDKDDYRGAAAIARDALQAGQTVWWNADLRGGRIYNVP